jgi:phosphonate transport system ATP-binding protein
MIFQQFNLVKRLDVMTNVLMGRLRYNNMASTLLKLYSKADRAMAVKALDRVGILDQAFQRCDTLSGGQQQRVAIARALMQEPTIILADEPIASLDPKSAKMVMETLQSIHQQDGITVIASLHHLASAREYTQRIIGMAQGRVLFDGGPDALTSDKVREIYGVREAQEELEHDSENVTAMALSRKQTPPPPVDTSRPPDAEEKAVQAAVS